ncbi:carbohydrate-binding domain-containing protein [uncultured Desulfobacter sp.]|uniref:carbohydrate-binding domain-containing protein n=1 Tax=uncultured Desulfobacter sp. TaxID=240139 RepID=UPI002AAB47BD|nr:carbohydrate-binding domain-containing protein [uncultured Desulfobacter sp.]
MRENSAADSKFSLSEMNSKSILRIITLLLLCAVFAGTGCNNSDDGNDSKSTYTIAGMVSGDMTAGVTITLSGNGTSSTATDASGTYSFTAEAGTYTITPSLGGYIFSPASTSVTITDADVSHVDFTCTLSSDTGSTITIVYNGSSVAVTNPLADEGVVIAVADADVTVTSTADISGIIYNLSGTTSDGMFKIYSDNDFLLQLDGVDITNQDGPAINIQADVTISVELMEQTTSLLTDGETYADAPDDEDQKAAFFSEGQILFSGNGSLVVYGTGDDQHGLGSDDYIVVDGGAIIIASSSKDGIHTNEGYYQSGGTVDVTAGSDGVDAGDGPVRISGGSLGVVIEDDDRDGIKCDGDLLMSAGTVDISVGGDQSKGLNAADVELTGGITTIETSGNAVLEESGSGYDPSYCTGIKADNSVVVNGAHVYITTTGKAGRGISSDGSVEVYSGGLTITSSGDGSTYTDETGTLDAYHGPCIKSDGNLILEGGTMTLSHSGKGGRCISGDGTLTIGASDSAPTLNATATGEEIYISAGDAAEAKAIKADGIITVNSGTITVSSADDAIKSEEGIEINGGSIDIEASVEGIEAPNITINDGEIHVNASDDGMNATFGSDVEGDDGSMLTINGGYIDLSASAGDGIDSNGSLTIAGGTVIVHGPPSSPELGLDVNGDLLINGGLVAVAQVNSNMVETPGQQSGQPSVLLSWDQTSSAGTLFHIEDSAGNTLITFAPEHRYSSVLVSSSDLTNGTTYKVYTGGSDTGTELDGLYTGGTYSAGTLKTTFVSSGTVQTVNLSGHH